MFSYSFLLLEWLEHWRTLKQKQSSSVFPMVWQEFWSPLCIILRTTSSLFGELYWILYSSLKVRLICCIYSCTDYTYYIVYYIICLIDNRNSNWGRNWINFWKVWLLLYTIYNSFIILYSYLLCFQSWRHSELRRRRKTSSWRTAFAECSCWNAVCRHSQICLQLFRFGSVKCQHVTLVTSQLVHL